jgi:hypothetical protein
LQPGIEGPLFGEHFVKPITRLGLEADYPAQGFIYQ